MPRFSLKIDIRKTFDSVSWPFMLTALNAMGFTAKFLTWIKECVSTPMFSVKINGQFECFFKGKKGLRKGDSLSLYLFIVCMEVLSQLLHKTTTES